MTTRAQQYEATRRRIVDAAVGAFSELGFYGASTRAIAARAGANQGLITYHFRSKDELWKAAAEQIFSQLASALRPALDETGGAREQAREAIRRYVRFAAAHPELFRFMVEEGKGGDDRMQWLVDTHMKPLYLGFQQLQGEYLPDTDPALMPHVHYALAGAASLIFAVAPECIRLTGMDPTKRKAIDAHAEFVSRLFVP